MVDPETLSALSGLAGAASEQLEFWRQHKGERVVIRENSIRTKANDRSKFKQTIYATEGTISEVLSLPPGFVLTDVEERILIGDFSMLFGTGSATPQDISPGVKADESIREVEEKFVAFSAIDELERAEHAENATSVIHD